MALQADLTVLEDHAVRELRRRAALGVLFDEEDGPACVVHLAHSSGTPCSSLFGSRPIDGSSSTTSRGSSIRLRANSTNRCWPPDRLAAFSASLGHYRENVLYRLSAPPDEDLVAG